MTRGRDREDASTRAIRILKNRILEIRALQLLGGIRSSELFKMIASIFRETGGNTVNVFLIYLIRQLEDDERRNR